MRSSLGQVLLGGLCIAPVLARIILSKLFKVKFKLYQVNPDIAPKGSRLRPLTYPWR